MFGLPLASVGAVGVTAGPSPAAGVAEPADPVAVFESALGSGGVAFEPVETAVVDWVSAGAGEAAFAVTVDGPLARGAATGAPATAFAAPDRVRNRTAAGEPAAPPGA